MADESQTLRAINWRDVFPFVNLFRAFRVAVHPSKLVLALVALIGIYTGGRFLDWVWPEKHKEKHTHVVFDKDFPFTAREVTEIHGVFDVFFRGEIVSAEGSLISARRFDLEKTRHHVTDFFLGWLFLWEEHWVFALIFSAWFLLIWSLFGGAISRIAAVHVARDEKISVRQAVRFSANKILSFIFAPLIPILITLAIGVVLAAVGFVLFHIPVAGPILAGLFWFLALLGGLLMALVVIGLVGGFNLMYPTIAVEGSDSFDAISRSFSYVFARPWRMLFYTAVSLVYGSLCFLFVRFFTYLILLLTWIFVGWWLTSKQVGLAFPQMFPRPSMESLSTSTAPHLNALGFPEKVAGVEIAFWNYLLISLLGAFAISFYFSISTITYYLMRREVDATEMEDVYVEEAEDDLTETGPIAAAAVVTTTVATTDAPASDAPAPSGEPAPQSEPPPAT